MIKTNLIVAAQPYLNHDRAGSDLVDLLAEPARGRRSTSWPASTGPTVRSLFHPIPTGIGPSEYWGYRWQKYGESLSEAGGSALLRPYAEWVVGQDQREAGAIPSG